MTTEDLAARQHGNNNGRLILFIGLALGIVAAVLVALILTGSKGSTEKIVPATRIAVVSNQDIPARTRLTGDMLQVKTYNLQDVNSDAYTSVNQLTNRVTATDIKAGQVFVPNMVSDTTGEGLTFSVSPGMRAVSIRVQEVVTAGGNLAPDNHVDIVGVFKVPEGSDVGTLITALTGQPPLQPIVAPKDASVIFTILQNVRVLAVAQNLTDSAKQSSTGANAIKSAVDQSQTDPGASTVTLEVTPQQAEALATADLYGTLRLSLRPFGEADKADVTPILVTTN
ncbi:MAG TPA: Flp pilus assembly protein CpaB [Dehalococcoidia bacterium]|nr:Flp pilus assembly protein CpaB [Dehalococcoidia bacterium]